MRGARDGASLARLRVRSNGGGAVSAVANSVVLDASPRALIAATFVGSPGIQYDTPPVALDQSDEITLAGDSPSIPELAGGDTPATRVIAPHGPPAKPTAPPPPGPAGPQPPPPPPPPRARP